MLALRPYLSDPMRIVRLPTRVKAFVVLKDGETPSDEMAEALQVFVKERLASYSYPREIAFLEALPMTVTGKVIRKELKARAAAEGGS